MEQKCWVLNQPQTVVVVRGSWFVVRGSSFVVVRQSFLSLGQLLIAVLLLALDAVSRIRSPGEVAVMSHGIGCSCSVCMYVVCPMFALYLIVAAKGWNFLDGYACCIEFCVFV